jgi:hypothetical protein
VHCGYKSYYCDKPSDNLRSVQPEIIRRQAKFLVFKRPTRTARWRASFEKPTETYIKAEPPNIFSSFEASSIIITVNTVPDPKTDFSSTESPSVRLGHKNFKVGQSKAVFGMSQQIFTWKSRTRLLPTVIKTLLLASEAQVLERILMSFQEESGV